MSVPPPPVVAYLQNSPTPTPPYIHVWREFISRKLVHSVQRTTRVARKPLIHPSRICACVKKEEWGNRACVLTDPSRKWWEQEERKSQKGFFFKSICFEKEIGNHPVKRGGGSTVKQKICQLLAGVPQKHPESSRKKKFDYQFISYSGRVSKWNWWRGVLKEKSETRWPPQGEKIK
jgi:hypothetical protein